nr:hypothetical protein [Tanacetum cinerariifolium]
MAQIPIKGCDEGRQTLGYRLSMVYTRDDGQELFTSHSWRRLFEFRGLHTEEEMVDARFGAYWSGRLAPSYVFIRDPVRRLCNMMIACSISGRGHAPEKACLGKEDWGQVIRRSLHWASSGHIGLVNDQGLRGLSVVASELPLIDLHELGRLNIYLRVGDTWAWVASGPKSTRAGTSATATHSSAPDYVLEDREDRGGDARVTTECCRLTRSC